MWFLTAPTRCLDARKARVRFQAQCTLLPCEVLAQPCVCRCRPEWYRQSLSNHEMKGCKSAPLITREARGSIAHSTYPVFQSLPMLTLEGLLICFYVVNHHNFYGVYNSFIILISVGWEFRATSFGWF